MFQFRRFPTYTYLIQCRLHRYCLCGLPHSEIPGSMDICSSPRLIAACRVLLRLSVPRHSPCALISLTNQKLAFACSLIVELCRRHSCFFEIVLLPFILSDVVPQLKFPLTLSHVRSFCCLTCLNHHTLFSFQGAFRRSKLHIIQFAASGESHSLRCSSSFI